MATKFPVEEFVLPSVDIEDICKGIVSQEIIWYANYPNFICIY